MHWANPQAFWLLLLLPAALWPLWRRQPGIRISALSLALAEASAVSRWAVPCLSTLRAMSLALLIVAAARPQSSTPVRHADTEGIAIQIVLDASLSMRYTDYSLAGQSITRLDAARHAIRLFVRGDETAGLPPRGHDLIGLVTFNEYPDVLCPLTTCHDALLATLEEVTLGPYTNLGDGLAWGLDRLRHSALKQRIVVLLSDGKHNAPDGMDPLEAGRLAADLGIRVYTIGAVGQERPPTGARFAFWSGTYGERVRPPSASVDEDTLRRIASMTGGKYFRATDTDALVAVYNEIDQLEKGRIEHPDLVVFEERFVGFLVAGLAGLAIEQVLAATRFLIVG